MVDLGRSQWLRGCANNCSGGRLRIPTRLQVVRALALHKAPECLPLLVDVAQHEPIVSIRAEAIDGIRGLCGQIGPSTDPTIGALLGDAIAAA